MVVWNYSATSGGLLDACDLPSSLPDEGPSCGSRHSHLHYHRSTTARIGRGIRILPKQNEDVFRGQVGRYLRHLLDDDLLRCHDTGDWSRDHHRSLCKRFDES